MAELEPRVGAGDPGGNLVIDGSAVEAYVRDSQLALTNACLYLAGMGGFVLLRVVLAVPYLRAAAGLAFVMTACGLAAKQLLPGRTARRAWLFLAASVAGAITAFPVLVALVEVNRGTIFAAAAAGLVGAAVTHVVDRVALARA